MSKKVIIACRNVFQSGKHTPAIDIFKKLWSEHIQQEKPRNPPGSPPK